MNQPQLSKADLMFLALVSSGKIKLDDMGPEHKSDRGVGIAYVPELRAIAKNLMYLNEVYSAVKRQVEEIERGEDPLRKIDEGLNA